MKRVTGSSRKPSGSLRRFYAFYENNPTGTPAQSAAILAAGPLGSLVLGGLFRLWYDRLKSSHGFWRLLLFWLAWLGIMEFVNYLIVTPWLTAGDTAQLADIAGAPLWSRYAAALLGAGLVFLLAPSAAADMFAVAPAATLLDEPRARRRYIMRGFYLPLFAGVVLTGLAGNRRPTGVRDLRLAGHSRQHRHRRCEPLRSPAGRYAAAGATDCGGAVANRARRDRTLRPRSRSSTSSSSRAVCPSEQRAEHAGRHVVGPLPQPRRTSDREGRARPELLVIRTRT